MSIALVNEISHLRNRLKEVDSSIHECVKDLAKDHNLMLDALRFIANPVKGASVEARLKGEYINKADIDAACQSSYLQKVAQDTLKEMGESW